MNRLTPYLTISFVYFFISALGQTPGQIFIPSSGTSTFFDPNGDGYITASGSAFTASDELAQFEGQWSTRFQITSEPSGDAATGSGCASTDIVDEPTNEVSMYTGVYDPDGYPSNNDGDEYFLARLRIGKDPGTANFGYSILIDSDNNYGSGVDGNYLTGNGGFEIEIRLKNGGGGKGVFLDDVDGTTSGTNKASYSITTHHQKSYAKFTSTGCTNDPVFVDIAVPFSDLTTYFGLNASSNVRLVGATTTNGSSALGSNISDLSGTDDNDPAYITIEDAIADMVDNQPTNQALPVELVNFELVRNEYLIWTTASEVNTEFFEIQQSENGIDYTGIGRIEAIGNGLLGSTYRFDVLENSANSTYFYRLKIVDFDGSTEYSSIIHGEKTFNTESTVAVFPNPTNDQLFFTKVMDGSDFDIVNADGRLILSGIVHSNALSIKELDNGMYFLRIRKDGLQWNIPVAVQH